jgi:pimeloyl-ACP methyl ester carboxylesterase
MLQQARRRRSRRRLPIALQADPGSVRDARDVRPTIVFLHGTRLTGSQWATQVAALSDAYHCLAVDLPGHGHQQGVPFTLEGAAERVADLIKREAHGGRAIVVGLSLGGYVAMALAARWPERVAGLAICGATAEPVGPRAIFYRGLAAIFSRIPDDVLDAVNRRFFGWRFPPEVAAPILADGFYFDGGAVAVRSLIGERFRPRLAAYPGPSLLLNGEYDLFFRPTERSFANVAANPRRALIRRATHHTNLDQPEAFTIAIRRFAAAVSAGSVG